MPFLSIVIPAYNVEKYIGNLLDILIPQLNERTELIVVDDGSTDNSSSIIKNYAKNFENIRLITQKNSGASAARNKGIELSRGDYIAFIDSDDIVSGDYIDTVLKICKSIGADIVQFNYFIETDTGEKNIFDYKEYGLTEGLVEFKKYGYLLISQKVNALWNKVFKSSVIKNNKIVCPVDMIIGEDACFVTDVLYYAKSIYYADKAVYHYRIVSGSLMNSGKLSSFDDYMLLLSKYKKFNETFEITEGDILTLSLIPDCVFHGVVHLSSDGYSNKTIYKAMKKSGILKELNLYRISDLKPLLKTLLIKLRFYRLSAFLYRNKSWIIRW